MAIEHADITDAERHEPKGASTAAVNTVYLSDGAGSGAWALPSSVHVAADITLGKTTNNTTATTCTSLDTYYPIGGTWATESASGITIDTATGKFTIVTPGDYLFEATFSCVGSRNSGVPCFSFLVGGVATGGRIRRKFGTSTDVGSAAVMAYLPSLVATNYIQLGVQCITSDGANGAGDTVTLENASIYASLVRAT